LLSVSPYRAVVKCESDEEENREGKDDDFQRASLKEGRRIQLLQESPKLREQKERDLRGFSEGRPSSEKQRGGPPLWESMSQLRQGYEEQLNSFYRS